ncbi:MAG: asparagine synthetase B family protein, partial [Thermoanaerobaculia bacterium]|nr:asparagine synthetase B family protein [Thermoanaerobaculia bacterium]
GAVLLLVEHLLRRLGQSPARLKAFTLAVTDDNGRATGPDLEQARRFLRETELEMLGEAIEVDAQAVDPWRAVAVIEDYKALDVECAAVALALAEGIRARYPQWRYLIDGDGGDENLKDYPIEENRELTIRSVVGNSMLYQEGWGVDAVKHSLTYSGGYSRGCVRTYAPLRQQGFVGFSPFTRPAVVAAAEAIPFDELSSGSHERLYGLKGEILARGILAVTGRTLPVFPKRRFQDGALPDALRATRFAGDSGVYRRHFLARFS